MICQPRSEVIAPLAEELDGFGIDGTRGCGEEDVFFGRTQAAAVILCSDLRSNALLASRGLHIALGLKFFHLPPMLNDHEATSASSPHEAHRGHSGGSAKSSIFSLFVRREGKTNLSQSRKNAASIERKVGL